MEKPEATVLAMYAILCGPADEERDWDAFRSLFWPGATVTIPRPSPDGEVDAGEWDVEDFILAATEEYAEAGFWEDEIWSRTESWGNIAHVWSTYESRYGSPDADPAGRGINSIQLVRYDDDWLIISIIFDIESLAEERIPKKYGGSP